jgi:hypothetical protein
MRPTDMPKRADSIGLGAYVTPVLVRSSQAMRFSRHSGVGSLGGRATVSAATPLE